MNNKDQEDLDYLKRNSPCCVKAMNELADLRAELEKLQAVFSSLAPTNSKAYEGLLGTGQALIDKDQQIADLREASKIVDLNNLSLEGQLADLRAENDQLKAQLEDKEQLIKTYAAHLAHYKTQSE